MGETSYKICSLLLAFILVFVFFAVAAGQYYRSSNHAYAKSSNIVSIQRLNGPTWSGPHPGCIMCLGNHLIGTHGQIYFNLNNVGWQQWSTVHDNAHNGAAQKVGAKQQKSDPNLIFVPTPQIVVDKMLEVANIKSNDVVYDLGCGDGRIVIAASKKYGVKSIGYEINPELVKLAKENVQKSFGDNFLESPPEIKQQDILEVDLSGATVITLYLFPELNAKLVPQLKKMKTGSRIVSHYHKIPGLIEDKTFTITVGENRHTVYQYTIKPTNVGSFL